MKDILRRLYAADPKLAVELIARGAFTRKDVKAVIDECCKVPPRAKEPATLERMLKKQSMVQAIGGAFLTSRKPFPAWAFSPGFIPAAAHGDRQLAIHAVINCPMTDAELDQLDKLTSLQTDGHLLRQLRVAIEIEKHRRKTNARRGGGNRISTERG